MSLFFLTMAAMAFDLYKDPLQFPHRYEDPLDIECVAFISALFAYGQRPLILALLEKLLAPLGSHPVKWLLTHKTSQSLEAGLHKAGLTSFRYRFNTDADYLFLLQRLQWVYASAGSLQALLAGCLVEGQTYRNGLSCWIDALLGKDVPESNGIKYLFAHPKRGGSCKRLHLFLRWMVRGPDDLDFGLWKSTLCPSRLLIPLDTHVAKAARHLGWVDRAANDWQTVEAITERLRHLCPHDPVARDVELFTLGQTL